MITGLDRTYHAHEFIFGFLLHFLFVPCGRLSCYPSAFYCIYTIVSYRIDSDALV